MLRACLERLNPHALLYPWAHPLERGILQQRYKRFLADVVLEDSVPQTSAESITTVAHCPNTGAMHRLVSSGNKILCSRADNIKRKHLYTLEASYIDGQWVGLNTQMPNRFFLMLFHNYRVFEGYTELIAEPRSPLDPQTRFDFCLKSHNQPDWYIEIKNVHDSAVLLPPGISKPQEGPHVYNQKQTIAFANHKDAGDLLKKRPYEECELVYTQQEVDAWYQNFSITYPGHKDYDCLSEEQKAVRVAVFPDSKTERGAKHIQALLNLKERGYKVSLLYIVRRDDVEALYIHHKKDPIYGQISIEAFHNQLDVAVMTTRMDEKFTWFDRTIDYNPIPRLDI